MDEQPGNGKVSGSIPLFLTNPERRISFFDILKENKLNKNQDFYRIDKKVNKGTR